MDNFLCIATFFFSLLFLFKSVAFAFGRSQGLETHVERNSESRGGTSWKNFSKINTKLMSLLIPGKIDICFVLSARSHLCCAVRSLPSEMRVKSFMVVKALPAFPS